MKTDYYDAEHKCPYCKKGIVVWSDKEIEIEKITKNPPIDK